VWKLDEDARLITLIFNTQNIPWFASD